MKKAEKLFEKGDIEKSKEMYLKALAEDPSNIVALNNLATIYYLLENPEKAKGYSEILLKECNELLNHEKDTTIMGLKIYALMHLGRISEANEVADEILQINPKDSFALRFKVHYLEKARNPEDVIGYVEELLDEYPHDVKLLLSKGKNLAELNRFDEAEECYNHVFEIEPKNKMAISLKSELLKKKHNLTLTSHDLMLKAVESFEMENFTASKDYFKKALDMSPEYDEIWFAQGELFIRTGYIGDAIDSFKKAFEINPTSGGIVKHKEFFKMLNRMKKINSFLGNED